MSIKYLIPAFIMLSMSLGCSQYPISGHIEMNGSDKHPMVYLVDPVSFNALVSSFEGKVIDSAGIDQKGQFRFEKMPASNDKKMYILTIQQQGEAYPNKLENESPDDGNYIPFIYQSSKNVTIHSSADRFLKDAVIRSDLKENNDIVHLISKRSELYHQYISQEQAIDESNLMAQENARLSYQRELLALVSDDKDIYIQALALRWLSPNGDYERIPELVMNTCRKLQSSSPSHPWTLQICKKASALPLIPGDQFPDFPVPMTVGDTTNIYALLGSKLTLIDLWASWCAPCRHENKTTLVPLWDQFHNQGFQIIGYALDSSEKGWKQAIDKDGANRWPHASHLKGDESPLFEALKITTIPANYLVDQYGKIVAKNLHGEELTHWVAAYLR